MEKSDLKEIRKALKARESCISWVYGLYVDPDDIQIMRKSEMSPEPGSYGIKKTAEQEEDAEGSSETAETAGGSDV